MPVRTIDIELPARYLVRERIASGGMATVWAAQDDVLGRAVAIKVLAEHLSEDPRTVARFEREARTAAGLSSHPHVVTIYDVGEVDGRTFIVMEHMDGGSLAEPLRANGAPPRAVALRLLDEAAQALDFAHEREVVHRDVKPANLLLDERGRLAVGDFGIARAAADTELTGTGQVMGTVAYLSPEQANGRPATPASDRYALALVAFELLTGERPFPGDNPGAQLQARVAGDPAPAPSAHGLPAAFDAPLLRGLDSEPDARPATAAELMADLRRAEGSGPGAAGTSTTAVLRPPAAEPRRPRSAGAPPAKPHPPRPAQRRERPRGGRALLVGLGVVALLAVVAAIVLASTGGDDGGDQGASSQPAREQPRSGQPADEGTAAPSGGAPADESSSEAATGDDAVALNDQGKALLDGGDASGAIPLLQRAVDASDPSAGATYYFALYNLADAYRQNGQPGEAIPLLEERLNFPNQVGLVQSDLDAARREAGQGTPGGAPAVPGGQGNGKSNGKGKGNGKGDGG